MKYTVKDVCKIYKINRETLRYYEKEGLIKPIKDEYNNYRYYDEWEINFIGECRKYRSMGFSIQEIKEVLSSDNLEQFIQKVESKQKDIDDQLHFYQMWSKRNSEYVTDLKNIIPRLGKIEIVDSEPRYIMPYRKQYNQLMDKKTINAMTDLMENHTFVDSMLFIPYDDYMNKTENFYWGFSIRDQWVDALNFPAEQYIHENKQKCICTTIDAGDKGGVNYNLFKDVMTYMEYHRFKLCGDIFGILLTRVHENGKYCRYLEMYFPITDA